MLGPVGFFVFIQISFIRKSRCPKSVDVEVKKIVSLEKKETSEWKNQVHVSDVTMGRVFGTSHRLINGNALMSLAIDRAIVDSVSRCLFFASSQSA